MIEVWDEDGDGDRDKWLIEDAQDEDEDGNEDQLPAQSIFRCT